MRFRRADSPTYLGRSMLRCLAFACVSAAVAIQCVAAPPSGRSGAKAGRARVSRRVGGDGREYRLAIEAWVAGG